MTTSAPTNPATREPISDKPALPRSTSQSERSITDILKQMAHEVPQLFTKELGLAKAEARESVHTMLAGVAAVATGGAVMMAGLIILLLAAVAGLSIVLAPWLAALIIGAAAVLVGALMVAAGKKQFAADTFKPQRTVDSMKKDQTMVQEKTS